MSQVFDVVFTGRLTPVANREDAVRDFASVFKVDEERARSLIAAGEERVLKRDVDEANAKRYLDVLGEIGLEARIAPPGSSNAHMAAAGPAPASASRGDSTPNPTMPPDAPDAGPAPSQTPGQTPSQSPGQTPGQSPPPSASQQPTPPSIQPPMQSPPHPPGVGSTAGAPAGGGAIAGPFALSAGHGWAWITQAWALFKQQPRIWSLAVALVYLVTIALSMVPAIGSLATMILGPVFAGGLMLGAQTQQRTGTLTVVAGFDGFSRHGGQLALVGLLYLLGLVLVFVAAGLVAVTAGGLSAGSLEALNAGDPEVVAAAMGPGILSLVLVATLFFVPLLMAYWFAPPLVALDGLSALDAMRMSFVGCLKNILPFLAYGLALFFLLVGMSVLFGLLAAMLSAISESLAMVAVALLIPLMLVFAVIVVLSIYTGYRDVFRGDERSSDRFAF